MFVIIIIASFLRLYKITTVPPGLYPDEAMNGNNAIEALRTGQFRVFYPENNGREGLFINIQAVFLKFFGTSTPLSAGVNEPWVLRLPSAIFGILTVLGIYFLAAELFSSTSVGLLSALLLATSFWHINFSRIGFRAIMAPFFLVWALYFFIRALRSENSGFRALYPVFSGIFYGLGFYTYISYRVSPLLFLLFIPFFRKEKVFWRTASIFLITTLIVALPIGIYYLKNPADFFGRTTQISVFSSPTPLKDLGLNILRTAGMFNVRGDYNWRHNLSGAPELLWPVGILFLIGIAIAIKNLIQNSKIPQRARLAKGGKNQNDNSEFKNGPPQTNSSILNPQFSILVTFLWLILAALPVIVSNEGIPHALRSILMIPPVFILAALGGVWLYKFLMKYNWQFLLKAVAATFFLLITLRAYNDYFIVWAQNPNTRDAFSANYVEIGREINNLPASTPKYVVIEASGVLVHDIPMPAQTVMFITNTYLPQDQQAKNVHYILPDQEKDIPANAAKFYLK